MYDLTLLISVCSIFALSTVSAEYEYKMNQEYAEMQEVMGEVFRSGTDLTTSYNELKKQCKKGKK